MENNNKNKKHGLSLEKGKRGALNILFGKSTLVVLLILVQVVYFIWTFTRLRNYLPVVFSTSIVVIAISLIYLGRTTASPEVKLSWIAVVIMFPIVGAVIYMFVHTDLGYYLESKRLRKIDEISKKYDFDDKTLTNKLSNNNEYYGVPKYLKNTGGFSAYENTDVEYYPSGEKYFESLMKEIEKAEKFIFLEFFIIDDGYMWNSILDVLAKKAKDGVDVRLMYDGMCALYRFPYSYPKKMQELGIKCRMFAPIHPIISTSYNNRDHRKILVVDGKVAFTGGVNLADEYINIKTRFGKWKDAAVSVRGDAVYGFTLMFLKMWNVYEENCEYDRFLSAEHEKCLSKGYVVPYGDSPLDNERMGESVYLEIINRAKQYVYIMSPYLILDSVMTNALTLASKRGVDVRIILPHIPDKKYAFALAKSHYAELIGAGVKIYEYAPGFIHSKVFLSDATTAVVGTINLDYRSLYLHFECALYMKDVPAIADIYNDFTSTFEECIEVTTESIKNEKFFTKLSGKLLKLIAPLM